MNWGRHLLVWWIVGVCFSWSISIVLPSALLVSVIRVMALRLTTLVCAWCMWLGVGWSIWSLKCPSISSISLIVIIMSRWSWIGYSCSMFLLISVLSISWLFIVNRISISRVFLIQVSLEWTYTSKLLIRRFIIRVFQSGFGFGIRLCWLGWRVVWCLGTSVTVLCYLSMTCWWIAKSLSFTRYISTLF